MSEAPPGVPVPPRGLRPAQIGIVAVGRSTLGHVAATFVDLQHRGLLRITSADLGNAQDWQLTTAGPSVGVGEEVLDLERRLLELLGSDGGPRTLAQLRPALGRALHRFRDACRADAVRRGWFGHLHHERRTEDGVALAREIQRFRMRLLKSTPTGGDATWGDLRGYAMVLGQRGDPTDMAFASDLLEVCSDLPDWKPQQPSPKDFSDSPWLSESAVLRPGYIMLAGSGL